MLRADQETVLAVQGALAAAATRGTDPVRALDELGFLFYKAKHLLIMADVIEEAAQMLSEITVQQLALIAEDRRPQTPLDTKRHVERWLRVEAEKVRKAAGS